jgi:hypothetical protein
MSAGRRAAGARAMVGPTPAGPTPGGPFPAASPAGPFRAGYVSASPGEAETYPRQTGPCVGALTGTGQ